MKSKRHVVGYEPAEKEKMRPEVAQSRRVDEVEEVSWGEKEEEEEEEEAVLR